MNIDFKSPTVLKDLDFICELARESASPSWAIRIDHYRALLKKEIDEAESAAQSQP